jgi:hypothetical protein
MQDIESSTAALKNIQGTVLSSSDSGGLLAEYPCFSTQRFASIPIFLFATFVCVNTINSLTHLPVHDNFPVLGFVF